MFSRYPPLFCEEIHTNHPFVIRRKNVGEYFYKIFKIISKSDYKIIWTVYLQDKEISSWLSKIEFSTFNCIQTIALPAMKFNIIMF